MKDINFNCAFYNLSAFVITTCVISTPSPLVTLANTQSGSFNTF